MDRDSLERLLEQGVSLAEVGRGLGRHESTVAYWVARYQLQAAGRARHAARGALARGDLERLVDAGATVAEMAQELDRSKTTVRHWLGKYGLKTAQRPGQRRSEGSRTAWAAGLALASIECPSHGVVDHVLDSRGYYRCKQCRCAAVARRRRKVKATLVREFGGACQICGYSRCLAALEFHHRVPALKAFSLSQEGVTRSLERARAEAEKCVLLCGNCHAEVEAGVTSIGLSARLE